MPTLLEGKIIASGIKEEIKRQINSLGFAPTLVSIAVGENHGVSSYVKSQMKVSNELGVNFKLESLPEDTTQECLVGLINKLNREKSVNGIIVDFPLPKGINCGRISSCISPDKDVEGMHPENLGSLLLRRPKFIPCTAAAALELIKSSGVQLRGKEAVVIGHSEIIGKPLALMLMDEFATVTVCHIATSEANKLKEHVEKAEVLIVAVGKAGLIKGDWIKKDSVVIDVGINRLGDKIVGDVEFEAASRKASYITPVPGGVGPLTVVMLMRNLVNACKLQL